MKRRCLRCRALITTGSYCNAHKPRPASPGRVTGRRGQAIRAWVLLAHDNRCARCGADGVPLEVHHANHDYTDNSPQNLTVLCRRCHALAS